MALLELKDLTLSWGSHPILDHVNLTIERGERICLVGRNGEGKSSLLKLIDGQYPPDSGQLVRDRGLKVARLQQELPINDDRSVFDVVTDGLGDLAQLVRDYHSVVEQMAEHYDEALMDRMSHLQHELEARDGWSLQQQVDSVITRLELPADQPLSSLSGGWRRRVLLAQALVLQPDILLLDEPTNHLDVPAIEWLEGLLKSLQLGLIFVTHDRQFLQRLATRIIELDRGKLTSWPGDYENYLRRKAEREEIEATEHALFDKELAQEEVWIRQGIKARRTRNEGRVRRLEAMREQRQQRRVKSGSSKLEVQSATTSGKLVFRAEHVDYAWEDKPLIKNFSVNIQRGDRVGLVGANGCGKSSLLKLLLGDIKPDAGTIDSGPQIEVAYFDQQRARLDPDATLIENVGQGSDKVEINGKPRHIVGYLQGFLFSPERQRQPARYLSGGETNRLLLAKLFTQPANVMILDEPTNDLDMETLELLEDQLMQFDGTLLVVSHDRAFLDNVATSLIVFDPDYGLVEIVGGYQDYLNWRAKQKPATKKQSSGADKSTPATPEQATVKTTAKNKLSFKEKRELESLPGLIDKLEAEQAALTKKMSESSFYQQAADVISEANKRMEDLQQELEQAYERWSELDQ